MARAILLEHAEYERRQNASRVHRRRLRDMLNPLELPETEFIANFRLSKAGYQQVFEELRVHLPAPQRKTAIRNELKVLAALHFYAKGTFQRPMGSSIFKTMSQPTFSRCLREVSNAFNIREVLLKYIKFPTSQSERENIKSGFMEKFGFPGVIGCIAGTHVAIKRPVEDEEAFFNEKLFHSLNVMIICDANLKIIHVDASFGGETDNSYIWYNSQPRMIVERVSKTEHCWLLGDSGYEQRPQMMTPILDAASGSPEEYYNQLHCRARNTVKRCIDLLKARWRCLLAHRVLHYDPVTAGKIVNACVCLHNIANTSNAIHISDDDAVDVTFPNGKNQQPRISLNYDLPTTHTGDSARAMLVRTLWDSRPNR